MTIEADLGLRPLDVERIDLAFRRELKTRTNRLHDRMATYAGHAAKCVGSGPPKGLIALFVATETAIVLFLDDRGIGGGTKRQHAAGLLSAGSDVHAAGTMAPLTTHLFHVVLWMEHKQVAHYGLGELRVLLKVTGLAECLVRVLGL